MAQSPEKTLKRWVNFGVRVRSWTCSAQVPNTPAFRSGAGHVLLRCQTRRRSAQAPNMFCSGAEHAGVPLRRRTRRSERSGTKKKPARRLQRVRSCQIQIWELRLSDQATWEHRTAYWACSISSYYSPIYKQRQNRPVKYELAVNLFGQFYDRVLALYWRAEGGSRLGVESL